jgi:tRNA(Phe) wybutosine-synthesizing methylase Tyw3
MPPDPNDRYLPTSAFMTSQEVARAMGFRSVGAVSKARVAGRLPFRMFELVGRRGYFAVTEEVRAWLISMSPTITSRQEDTPR